MPGTETPAVPVCHPALSGPVAETLAASCPAVQWSFIGT